MIKRLSLAVVIAVAGCSTDEPAPHAAPTPTAAPASVAPPARSSATPPPARSVKPVVPPPVADGELVRRVLTFRNGVSSGRSTFHREADGRTAYDIRAACADADPERTLTYVVKVGRDQRRYVSSELPCDGTLRWDEIGKLGSGQVTVDLEGGPVLSAYAVIVPAERP